MTEGYCPACRQTIRYQLPPPIQTVAWDRELTGAYRQAVRFGALLGSYRAPRRKLVFRGGTWCVQIHNETANPPYSLIHVDGDPVVHLHPETRRLIHQKEADMERPVIEDPIHRSLLRSRWPIALAVIVLIVVLAVAL